MSSNFYPKLALTNIKNNSKTYIPFVLTNIGIIIMFFILSNISLNEGLKNVWGAEQVISILYFGNYVIGFFASVFLFYTNSFLIKNRKKELGLYNILGMEKKHIGRILMWETLIIGLSSILIGILLGSVFCKLLFLALLKLLRYSVILKFSISMVAILRTLILFAGIFVVVLIYNRIQIKLNNPIELLHGGQKGEKEPKTRWFLALLGVIALGAGYYIAQTTESPIAALYLFFVAVILVMIGTYFIFIAGSIVILKILRKNHIFYYKTKHFISISGMIYRMKQNAVGLANICILCTAVLVTISTSVSMYMGVEDELKFRYPVAVKISHVYESEEKNERLDEIVKSVNKKYNVKTADVQSYCSGVAFAVKKDNAYKKLTSDLNSNDFSVFQFLTLEDYNRLTGRQETLNENEVLLYSFKDNYKEDEITFDDKTLQVKKKIDEIPIAGTGYERIVDYYYVIANNLDTVNNLYSEMNNNMPMEVIQRTYSYDMDEEMEQYQEYVDELRAQIEESGLKDINAEFREENREGFGYTYGSILFIGIFLGSLFLLATALIIYYKQISEGFDDKERFAIMQKVGMSKTEVKSSIRSQILMIFFFPLIMAIVHIAFAYKLLIKILNIMHLYNESLYFTCTITSICVFGLVYAIVFGLTAKAYYKIVN